MEQEENNTIYRKLQVTVARLLGWVCCQISGPLQSLGETGMGGLVTHPTLTMGIRMYRHLVYIIVSVVPRCREE